MCLHGPLPGDVGISGQKAGWALIRVEGLMGVLALITSDNRLLLREDYRVRIVISHRTVIHKDIVARNDRARSGIHNKVVM